MVNKKWTSIRPPFSFNFHRNPHFKAWSLWHWSNFLHATIPLGKKVVRINYDETCVQVFNSRLRGNLVNVARKKKKEPASLTRNTHGFNPNLALAHLVCVCDDMEIQRLLPQVILVRESSVSEATAREISEEFGGKVCILRLERAWSTATVIREFFIRLRIALRHFRGTHEFIVYGDAYRAHISQSVWETAGRAGFRYCVIPALMTWVFQPCDTHVLAGYKQNVRILFSQALSNGGQAAFTFKAMIRWACILCRDYLNKKMWKHAFEHCGLVGHQHLVSWATVHKVGLDDVHNAPSTLPSLLELQSVFPRNQWLPLPHMFAAVLAQS